MSLAKKTLTGLSWTTSATFINVALQIGYTSWISKILSPEEFGLMALAMVVLGFGGHFSKMGIGQALVQKETLQSTDIRAAFTLSMLFSTFIFTIVYFSSPFIAVYFKAEILVEILQLMGLSLVISGFSIVSGNLLRREMKFKQVSLVNIASFVVSYPILGIVLALNGWGVWSLVYAALFQVVFNAVVQYTLKPHSVVPTFKASHFKPILSYGSKISLNGIIAYLMGNLENIFIARYIGKATLGYYNRAHLLVYLPAYHVQQSLTSVLFPAFSKLQKQKEKLQKAYTDVVTLTGVILIPICLGMLVAAHECVYIILGDGWKPAAPILQVLCLIVPFNLLVVYSGIVCDALNVLKEKILINIAILVLMLVSFYLLRNEGVFGFLLVLLLRDVIKTLSFVSILTRVFGCSLWTLLQSYIPGIYHGVITAACIYGVSTLAYWVGLPVVFVFGLQILVGGVTLVGQLLFIPNTYLKPVISSALTRIKIERFSDKKWFFIFHKYHKNSVVL